MTRVLIFAMIVMTMFSCIVESSDAERQKKIAEVAAAYNTTEEAAQKIILLGEDLPDPSKIIHFRDPKTNVCYAYFSQVHKEGNNNAWGGPGLATVNCELVEKELINPVPPPSPPPEPSCEQKLKEIESKQTPPVPAIPELLQP